MRIVYLSLAGVLFFSQQAFALCDSIGVKTVNGKNFIVHKVTKGEGLYGIGRQYGVKPAEIQLANTGLKNTVNLGQVILVPYKQTAKNASAKNTKKEKPEAKTRAIEIKPAKAPAKEEIYHTVAHSETLYSIAVKNGAQVDELKKWNMLTGNDIAIGQKLIVGYTNSGNALADASATKWQRNDETNDLASGVHTDGEVRINADGVKTTWKEINESGVASWIDDGSMEKEKKYALHRTAPVGTVIKLTNPMNGQSAVVKVIGRLPQDGTEENVLIKITKSSADKLGLRDKYFRLHMSYGLEVEKKK